MIVEIDYMKQDSQITLTFTDVREPLVAVLGRLYVNEAHALVTMKLSRVREIRLIAVNP